MQAPRVEPKRTEELVERARGGDAQAYDRLFDQVAARLLTFVRCRLGAELATQVEPLDVVQETYVEAHRSFARFEDRGPGSFRRWLMRIAENRLHDLADRFSAKVRRPPGARVHSEALDHLRAGLASPSTESAQREREAQLAAAIDALPAGERDAVLRRFFLGETLEEVAAATGTSERSVRRLLSAALLRLGDLLVDDPAP